MFKQQRLRVVPLSLSRSCVTRKKTARKWPRQLLEAKECVSSHGSGAKECVSSPGSHAAISFFSRFSFASRAREVPLSLSRSCVTRKKTARKSRAKECVSSHGSGAKECVSSPGSHAAISFFSRFSFASRARD